MSAFICSDTHIASLAVWYGTKKDLPSTVTQFIANELKRSNIKSVNWRYDDNVKFKKCNLSKAKGIDPDFAFKMAACLDYQSCGMPDYSNPLLQAIADFADTLRNLNIDPDIWELI
jgi:hypothetical protein